MILEIKFDKGEGLNLYINGQSEHLYFDYLTRVEALRRANKRFDKDLMQAASLYPNDKKGAFLWCYTSEFLRGENVTDLVKLYYLLELAKIVSEANSVEKIILSYALPMDAITELKGFGLLTIMSSGFYKGKIREILKVVYHSSISFKRNLPSFLKKRNPKFSGNLLDVNQSPTSNRLDPLDNYEFYQPYRVFSGQEHKIRGFDKEDVVVFRTENTLLDGIIQLYRAVTLSIFIKQNTSRLPKVYRFYFRFRDVFKLWSLLLYERGAEKYFKRNEIRNLVHVSTLTKPEYRILWAKAHESKINVTIIASRTLKTLSSSERLIEADIKAYSKASLPNNFIVRDSFSKDAFKAFHFCEQVKMGGRFVPENENGEKEFIKERVVYVVLTHIKECSEYLLNELKSINFSALGIQKIFFRSHPSAKFTHGEIQNYFPDFEVINHTGLSIHQCNYENILMISGPTTGALELIKEGVTLFWLPYVWKDGILFDDILKKAGHLCNSRNEFINIIHQASNNKAIDISEFNSENLISEQLKALI
ncbi:hypothetical protein [Mongoliitalea daihaiensis]|uniref:hypothetical protein n=1 Tax=Mongoliitalea daihaiensis TaxID=2782006 RepID=UPI001F451479|nr:hypothetical protein [Mongoliitalea daihaiensis]UJP64468.1 hypothetical protein IPZ59_16925 [Mongoliitalea daihaiensis]